MCRISLHDNDGLLECVLFINLLMKLTNDGKIGYVYERDTPKRKDRIMLTDQILAVTCGGVFLKVEMSVASSATR
jgi:hypothetical protein